ncbi:hypothetical protein L1049_019592 [Liquidambar formosana]|uniref:DUF4110 domain-containing protein n=1 Tax=Liquidambar formosana TaxID=63359 RepID=A0AAP0S8D6_LIQFO
MSPSMPQGSGNDWVVGHFVDFELAMYLLENASILETIIVDRRHPLSMGTRWEWVETKGKVRAKKRALRLERSLPPGPSESEWIESSEDDDEDDSEDEGNNGSNSDETDDDDEVEAKTDGASSLKMGDAVAIIKGQGKNLRRKEKRARIEQIRANLGLSDSQRTPIVLLYITSMYDSGIEETYMPGETLKDFYRRTNLYWQMAAHEHTQHTGEELRKDGFDLAEARY